ncbi:energy transducer TonB [Chryseobacterium sp. G0186]|uniref:energy transducer TonB n=1 Tax=Chryseobacterium sp. G0186 TaxID=2487064 RepID=UPI0013DE2C7B|nr:energy transducer TonB [Chryseobacterium sp. G0186]
MKKISLLIFLLGSHFAFSQATQQKQSQVILHSENKDVETPAEFPGGMDALRKYIFQEFDISNIKNSGTITSVTKFVVNTDGSIGSVSSTGSDPYLNKELDRIIKTIKIKWKPATTKGQPVKYWVRVPITINN